MDLPSDDDSSETYCLVCVAAYSDSRPNEKWIQCTACKEWAHEKYALIFGIQFHLFAEIVIQRTQILIIN